MRPTLYLLGGLASLSLACAPGEPKTNDFLPTDPSELDTDLPTVMSATPGDPVPGLRSSERRAFINGLGVFTTTFTPATGLGPLFNSTSCGACHDDPVFGGYGDSAEVHMSAWDGSTCNTLDANGGPVVQQHATPELTTIQGITIEPNPAGATGTGIRTTPIIFGMGLLDAVSDRTIKALARIRYPEGVHGRPAILPNGRVGRFGRKAAVASLTEFNAGAYFNEMGVTNARNPVEGTVAGTPFEPGVDPATEPEIDGASFAATNAFVHFLAPVAPPPLTEQTRLGKELFREVRCTSCHVPVLVTGYSGTAALRFKRIRAYTDLLLHDLGEAEADMCNGVATPSEFRTQPLMGMRFLDMFMHDGLSETIEQAIDRHGGEGASARDRFHALTPDEQAALVAFVAAL